MADWWEAAPLAETPAAAPSRPAAPVADWWEAAPLAEIQAAPALGPSWWEGLPLGTRPESGKFWWEAASLAELSPVNNGTQFRRPNRGSENFAFLGRQRREADARETPSPLQNTFEAEGLAAPVGSNGEPLPPTIAPPIQPAAPQADARENTGEEMEREIRASENRALLERQIREAAERENNKPGFLERFNKWIGVEEGQKALFEGTDALGQKPEPAPTPNDALPRAYGGLDDYPVELVKGAAEAVKNLGAASLKGAAVTTHGLARQRLAQIETPNALPVDDSPEARAAYRVRRGVLHPTPEVTAERRQELQARVDQPITEMPLFRAGDALEEFGKDALAPRPGFEPGKSWTRDIGSGFGSLMAGVGVAALNPAAAMLMFVTAGQGEAAERAIKAGATPEQVERAALYGTAAGATDAVDAMLRSLGSTGKALGLIKKVGYAAVAGALAQGGQEGFQQFVQNLIAQGIYKPDQDLLEDVPRNTVLGAIVGGAATGGFSAAQGRGGQPAQPAERERPPGLQGEILASEIVEPPASSPQREAADEAVAEARAPAGAPRTRTEAEAPAAGLRAPDTTAAPPDETLSAVPRSAARGQTPADIERTDPVVDQSLSPAPGSATSEPSTALQEPRASSAATAAEPQASTAGPPAPAGDRVDAKRQAREAEARRRDAARTQVLAGNRADLTATVTKSRQPIDAHTEEIITVAAEIMADESLRAEAALEQAAVRSDALQAEVPAAGAEGERRQGGRQAGAQQGVTREGGTEAAPAGAQTALAASVQRKADAAPNSLSALVNRFAEHLDRGGRFNNILAARRLAHQAGFDSNGEHVKKALELARTRRKSEVSTTRVKSPREEGVRQESAAQEDVTETAPAGPQTALTAGAQGKVDAAPNSQSALVNRFAEHLDRGGRFNNILAARRFARQAGFDPNGRQVKKALELARARSARQERERGGHQADVQQGITQEGGTEAAQAGPQTALTAGAQGKVDAAPNSQSALVNRFAEHLDRGGRFNNILAARRFARQAGFDPNGEQVKNALELARARSARQERERGGHQAGAQQGITQEGVTEATPAGAQAALRTAGNPAGPGLLPGEGLVGTYDDLIAAGDKGDHITPHHIPSANRMAAAGVSKGDGVAINMEQPFPGVGGRHRATFTYGSQADITMSLRDALAAGVWDARRIYTSDGLYTPKIRSILQELIQMNKANHSTIFVKPPR